MKRRGIAIGAIFIVGIFLGMTVVPGLSSGMSKDHTMEKWMQDHTVKVTATTTCKYEQGYLLVKEVYTGEELKERFGVEQFTKELKIPVEAEVLVGGKLRGMQEGEEKVFVTEKVTVLTSADDPPHWWDNYTYPQWAWSKSGDIYEKEDPINLAWKNTTKDTAKSEILEEGWYDWGTWYDFYVFDPVDGWKDDDNVADGPFGLFGRYHARLWQMSDGNVVANAHHDTPVPHEADELEEAEELVAGYFAEPDDTEWMVYEDSYNLDNNVTSPYSDGWCSQISYGSATWYVPDDYLKIQWAVDNATTGDTIIVRDGIYSENVEVNKSLMIQSENGSDLTIVQAKNSNDHVFEVTADYVNISGFTIKGANGSHKAGISLNSANYCNIFDNSASNNGIGIDLYRSDNNTIMNNRASNNDRGIWLCHSSNNTLTKNNLLENDYNFDVSGWDLSDFVNSIDTSNEVNGKPIYYWVNEKDQEVPNDAGYVGIVNSTNITVKDMTLTNNGEGILLVYSQNSKIKNVEVLNNEEGIHLSHSSNNTIFSNIFKHNYVYILSSEYNEILNNTCENSNIALASPANKNNTISNNALKGCGLYNYYSYGNIVEGNTVNERPLVYLEDVSGAEITYAGQVILVKCENVTVRSCNLSNANLGVELLQSSNCSIGNNTCNNNSGAGIYLEGSLESTISNNICENNNEGVWLQSSNNNIISNNTCENNDEGIHLRFSQNNTITNNIYEDNSYGIYLYHVPDSLIANNMCRGNTFGIYLKYQSSNNTIYLNNFINNVKNVYSSDSTNIWNSTEEMAYACNGTTCENYLGNYWDEFTDVDVNNDGIWDTPYSIDSDNDTYPLVGPWENYFKLPEEKIFDTGAPPNPYPSIMGNHTGTIKPNHTVIATKLYTYSCIGTGGHTEYARIGNKTWNATATWEGYVGDWHNITFDKTVVLLANETYNYTIRTGSYPQIHRNTSLLTANGWINCTGFIDANGKRYNNWVPAIRVW